METLLNLILKSGLGLLALYGFYVALLRHETDFRFNRLYLLLAPLVALVLPLLRWPSLFQPDTGIEKTLQAIQLAGVTITAGSQTTVGIFPALSHVALGLYLAVAFLLTVKLLRQLWQIHRLKAQATYREQTPDAVQILQLERPYASFAFLRTVFLGEQGPLSAAERQQVLTHELAHARLGHTYDILWYELLSIVLWFNPIVWLLKQELRNLHEFQADARVLEQHQAQPYRLLLSKEVLLNMGLPIGSHFQKPQVLQRLHMLQLHGKQPNWGKPLLVLPLVAALLFTLSSRPVAGNSFTQRTLKPVPAQSGKMPILKGDTTANMPVAIPLPNEDMPNGFRPKPYTYVEQMPQFKGGEGKMLEFLGTAIKYPEAASEAKLEGIVVASFVVQEDGRLTDVQIIKKLGMGTDEEVIRVVELMNGKWEPGRQSGKAVPVRYTLPIRFTSR
ncbi:M56 family metallopeptidase [Pontibacter sp. E15-1]|uniref:M56 family metallopeptidase n=1 Tax=Pontibacter sp. E15-1 TaxID=2919918 RepID=UPI001F4FD5A0|nr:M56 family metallopeptidase [Pontibacter sp. E15-1]MCJ8164465.1 M56 family metallopeptidase [Pontibacter sp. E15-1]